MEELDLLINSFPSLAVTREDGREIYEHAKTGLFPAIKQSISKYPPLHRKELLNKAYEDDGQKCTPLIIAARMGHADIIKHLLDYKVDIDKEVEGTVKFDGHAIEGATALWCAAGAGHLEIVRSLIQEGSIVDHETKSKSTPLRAACFEGRLEVVQLLCGAGADVNKANKYNNTCLMISTYKGQAEVVSFLLESGADPNLKALCGATACHFAADIGNIYIIESLLQHGARMERNTHGMSPLLNAAERCQAMMVEYLIARPEVSKAESVEALELLGASLANDNDNYDIGLAYNYLRRAIRWRWQEPVLEKTNLVQTPAYDNRLESRTLSELESISESPDQIHMEGLCIRERVLGQDNPELPYIIIFRGAIFADSARFDKCTLLWLHALQLRLNTNTSVCKDLLRFAQMFSQMLKTGHVVELEHVITVLAATVQEIRVNEEKRGNLEQEEDREAVEADLEQNLLTALYLINVIAKVDLKQNNNADVNNIPVEALKQIYKLVQTNPVTLSGASLLHLSVNQQTPVDDFHTNEICTFPCIATTKLLLKAGADPQSMDNNRDTPLHLIVQYTKYVANFKTLHSIILALLEAGAHIDSVNSAAETPLTKAASGVAEIILKSQSRMSLKCLAAKSVRKYNLSYQGQVPLCLESFIRIHGP